MNGDVFHPAKKVNDEIIRRIESFRCVNGRTPGLTPDRRTPLGRRHMTINPLQAAKSRTNAPVPRGALVLSLLEKRHPQEMGGG
jgi:hypothetical protein